MVIVGAGNYMPVGADYTGIKGILVLFRNIRVWGIPWGSNLWTPLLGPYFVKPGVPFDVPVCLYTHW
jgi:hypothetical protein